MPSRANPVAAQRVSAERPNTLAITMALRAHQEEDEKFGVLFKALHTYADRLMDRFYDDAPEMPYPVVAMERDRRNRLGYYTQRDGYALIHRINLNSATLRTGWDAAETLSHEIVHLWQVHIERPCKRNYHGKDFHNRMATYGIETKGHLGLHVGHTAVWEAWKKENEDLLLHKMKISDPKPLPRELLKHQCPNCGDTFRTRKVLEVLCIPCETPFEVVPSQRG